MAYIASEQMPKRQGVGKRYGKIVIVLPRVYIKSVKSWAEALGLYISLDLAFFTESRNE